MSFRTRSTTIRFSARSFSLVCNSWASAASSTGFAPRRMVPLIGLDSTSPELLTRRKRSGDEQQIAKSEPLLCPSELQRASKNAAYGAGLRLRRCSYTRRAFFRSSPARAALEESCLVRHTSYVSPAYICSMQCEIIARYSQSEELGARGSPARLLLASIDSSASSRREVQACFASSSSFATACSAHVRWTAAVSGVEIVSTKHSWVSWSHTITRSLNKNVASGTYASAAHACVLAAPEAWPLAASPLCGSPAQQSPSLSLGAAALATPVDFTPQRRRRPYPK
mmetsp:Transcript_2122/g.5453  ORF Transcript_2122/g.5453 Transcript_2122/m.5453 type:complete len:283 (+) Transcript_2122:854-1702(+)